MAAVQKQFETEEEEKFNIHKMYIGGEDILTSTEKSWIIVQAKRNG